MLLNESTNYGFILPREQSHTQI